MFIVRFKANGREFTTGEDRPFKLWDTAEFFAWSSLRNLQHLDPAASYTIESMNPARLVAA